MFYFKEEDCQQNAQCAVELEETSRSRRQKLVENLKEIFQDKSTRFSFALLSLLFAGVGLSGFSILSFYAPEIFVASGSPISASHTSWITSITKIVMSCGSFYVLHKFNRRSLFLYTSLLIFLSFTTMSVYLLLDNSNILNEDIRNKTNFIPMICVIMAYVGFGLGYGVLPSLIAAETVPVKFRSTAFGFFCTIEMLCSFLLSKLKPMLLDLLQMYGLFAMFSCTVLLTMVIMLKFKPYLNSQAPTLKPQRSME